MPAATAKKWQLRLCGCSRIASNGNDTAPVIFGRGIFRGIKMKIAIWPNGLGAMVSSGKLVIEVWHHGGARRCERDDSICGFSGTHFATVAKDTLENMGRAAIDLWNNDRNAWQPCE